MNYKPTRVLSEFGAEIDDVALIRDNDHLHLVDEEELYQLSSSPV